MLFQPTGHVHSCHTVRLNPADIWYQHDIGRTRTSVPNCKITIRQHTAVFPALLAVISGRNCAEFQVDTKVFVYASVLLNRTRLRMALTDYMYHA